MKKNSGWQQLRLLMMTSLKYSWQRCVFDNSTVVLLCPMPQYTSVEARTAWLRQRMMCVAVCLTTVRPLGMNEWMNECVRLSLLLCDRPDRCWNVCNAFMISVVFWSFLAPSTCIHYSKICVRLSVCLSVCHRCCVVSECVVDWHCSHVIIVFLSKLNAVPYHA